MCLLKIETGGLGYLTPAGRGAQNVPSAFTPSSHRQRREGEATAARARRLTPFPNLRAFSWRVERSPFVGELFGYAAERENVELMAPSATGPLACIALAGQRSSLSFPLGVLEPCVNFLLPLCTSALQQQWEILHNP